MTDFSRGWIAEDIMYNVPTEVKAVILMVAQWTWLPGGTERGAKTKREQGRPPG